MSQVTIGIGSALSLLGIGAFFSASKKHITALIPTFLGVPLFLLGVAGRREDLTQGAGFGAAGLSLLGLLVSLQGLFFPQLFPATAVSRGEYPRRGVVQTMTAVLCGLHLGMSVRSLKQEQDTSVASE